MVAWHPLQSGRRPERHVMQSCWDKMCNLGQDLYLEEEEKIVGRTMSRVWFWKADLETNEERNGVGQCTKI